MIENRIRMKMTLCNDGLIMATIDNLIGQKLNAGSYVNLLTLYNGDSATPLSAADALRSTEFLRFASMTMGKYKKYLATASTLYNDGSYLTFTPADKLKFIANTELAKAMDAYLYADTYHNEFVALDGYDEVAFWQGTGTSNGDRLKLDVTVADASADGGKAEVSIDGLVAVMFDRDAAGVCNQNFRTTSIYNPRGEYTNYFYKWDANYMNDMEENCMVFYVSDSTVAGVLPATAPDTWDSAYAVASSPYSVWDDTQEKYVQLSADDATTAAGYSWTKYANKSYLYTPVTVSTRKKTAK